MARRARGGHRGPPRHARKRERGKLRHRRAPGGHASHRPLSARRRRHQRALDPGGGSHLPVPARSGRRRHRRAPDSRGPRQSGQAQSGRPADARGQAGLGRRSAPVPTPHPGLRTRWIRWRLRAEHSERRAPLSGGGGPGRRRGGRSEHGGCPPRRPAGHRGAPSSPVRFFQPVPGQVGDGFGWIPPGRRHTGLDFPEPKGTPIHAGGVGVVSFAGFNSGGYGNLVVISHRLGFESWYAHMSVIAASAGQSVVGGQTIGYVGSTGHATGPHLHFEVRHFGSPIDPTPYLLSYRAASGGKARPGRVARRSGRGHHRRARRCRPNADARGRGADPLTARLDRCP